MQKFTIFTVIFSIIVVSITSELVVQDYLQKLYPPAETLQTNATNSATDTFKDFTGKNVKSKIAEVLSDDLDQEI